MSNLIIIITASSLPLLILGLLIRNGKCLMLIAGYNTMTQEDRDKIDKNLLSKTMGNLLLRMTIITALSIVAIYLEIIWATVMLIVIFVLDLSVTLVILNRKVSKVLSHKSQLSKVEVSITIGITVIAVIGVGIMFYYGEKEPVVSISDKYIQIEAMYGLDINFTDITDISLIDKSMNDIGTGRRTNGYAGFGDTLKGYFISESTGKILLFVKSQTAPTIRIVRDDGEDVYISFRDGEKTKLLYQELISTIPL